MNNSKYLIAGSILAGAGIIYANKKGINYEYIQNYIEENKEKFLDFLKDLMELSIEVLNVIMEYVKRVALNLMFKFKMAFC